MLANYSLVSCNFASLAHNNSPRPRFPLQTQASNPTFSRYLLLETSFTSLKATRYPFPKKGGLRVLCHSVLNDSEKDEVLGGEANGKEERDWTTSILLLAFWVAVLYYVFFLTPNQTPSRDMYFLQKLLNLKGDDGFLMNEILVSLWYIMGLWPLVYSMLLLPTGRSSKGKIPVWPFLVLSCFGGAYALLPYFVLWRPPPPPVEENELGKWPLNFLESKFTAWVSLAAGLGIVLYACLANGDVWNEFYQYFRESKFIHVTCLDFSLLSAFAPFWVYNDMTSRKWYEKGSWLLPISLVPFLGPLLYLVLRPSLSQLPACLTGSDLIRTAAVDRQGQADDVKNK